MRKLVVLILTLFVFACSTDDDYETTYFELLPIEDAIVPIEFERGEVYEILVQYIRPSTCHAYNDIYFERLGNERKVAVMSTVFQGSFDCTELTDVLDASFEFKAGDEDSYVFKFWQGEDDNGDDQYLIIEVPVVD